MKDFIKIGLIQPVLDPGVSWNSALEKTYTINMNVFTAERIWQDVKDGLSLLLKSDIKPEIILIPELHIPINRVADLKKISKRYNVMVIAGIDFYYDNVANKVSNRAIITIPNSLGTSKSCTRLSSLYFGKTYFTHIERNMFQNLVSGVATESREQNMYVFRIQELGNFGVMICSDIFDIERMMLYQGRLHHLFIISLNKDLTTYFSMAETLARLLYCNVIICNTGFYGGSIAIAPYRYEHDRLIYKHIGKNIFTTQLIQIPLATLHDYQRKDFTVHLEEKLLFKATPPGYFDKIKSIELQEGSDIQRYTKGNPVFEPTETTGIF